MVARDWRGGKVFYREWSKLGVERTLGAVDDEGSWEKLAPDYWKTFRLSRFPSFSPRVSMEIGKDFPCEPGLVLKSM
jgi:hypothetical protein